MIKAFVALESGFDKEGVKSGLKNLLPDYMIPKVIEVLEKLPVNKNGKIDRKLLDEL